MHSLLAMYGSDLVDENSEIPRAFTSAVVRAVMCTRGNDFVSWSEFLEGFPIAVRQRELLEGTGRPPGRTHCSFEFKLERTMLCVFACGCRSNAAK